MVTISEAITNALRAYEAGKLFEAEWICLEILQQRSDHVPTLQLLGAIAYRMGRLDTAIARYQQAITLAPDQAEVHGNLAVALHAKGDLEAAAVQFQRSLALDPGHAPTHCNLGNLALSQGNLPAAIAQYRQAIELNPNYAKAYNNLGNALRQQGQVEAAIAQFRQAIALDSSDVQPYNNLGNLLQQQGQVEAAIATYQQSLARSPQAPEIRANLAKAYNDWGMALYQRQQITQAIVAYEQAITLEEQFAEAHLNLSLALLATGNFQRGFREYEWRLRCPELHIPTRPEPRWDGSNLQGRSILLYAEQGFGDAIQFIRYIPSVAQRGGRVILACPPELLRLLSGLSGLSQLVPDGSALPKFSVQLPLLSLPFVLQQTLDIPQPPYLLPPEPTIDRKLPSTRLNVGLVWASRLSGDRRPPIAHAKKSVPLPELMALSRVPYLKLYSLQVGPPSADIARFGYGEALEDWSPRLKDFADTAAAIAQLDLVISIDTAVAHLAGALGKPIWVLLPFAADWRWLIERQDSPWYPTMRLFRQPIAGDWSTVITRVAAALEQILQD